MRIRLKDEDKHGILEGIPNLMNALNQMSSRTNPSASLAFQLRGRAGGKEGAHTHTRTQKNTLNPINLKEASAEVKPLVIVISPLVSLIQDRLARSPLLLFRGYQL